MHYDTFASGVIVDKQAWYANQSKIITDVNITLPEDPNPLKCAPYDNPTGALRPCTLEDVESDTNPFDTYKPAVAAVYRTTNFIPTNEQPNGRLTQKGKSTRYAVQKSYKFKLDSTTVLDASQRTMQYNKQYYDLTRIRNKLSFDIFQEIPNFPSLKTEFVHLYINDIDKGLFTKVEFYDKQYLLNRNWNPKSNLYKAQNFEFLITPELTLDSSGKPADLAAFSTVIEPEVGNQQAKLLEMLNVLNNTTTPIDTIINKYFSRDNYITWLAVNILTGNVDTKTQNFFLLNPLNSDTFYFAPWDYDAAWGWYKQPGEDSNFYGRAELSIARWWYNPLHRKFLSVKKNRDDLDNKIYELRANQFSDENIQAKIDAYMAVVEPIISSSPDIDKLNYPIQTWKDECNRLTQRLQDNIDNYEELKGSPMPFWQVVTYANGTLKSLWDKSIDLEGDEIVYDLAISNSPDFNTTLVSRTGLSPNDSDVKETDNHDLIYNFAISLSPGTYFFKVIAREKNNASHYMIAFDNYKVGGAVYHGVVKFVVQ